MSEAARSIEPYLHDASGYHGEAARVYLPADIAELRSAVAEAVASQTGITVAGAGTGLTGARVPHGGCVVSLERFRKLEIHQGFARCGAGVLLRDLHQAAARTHQFFGPNPTESTASIGGIVSTNAGGARSFRYGSVRRHVRALEVTFAGGETRQFRRGDKVNFPYQPVPLPRTTKNAAGYYLQPDLDWIELLTGSEGTLGIATEIELELLPEPAAILSGVVFFPSDDHAWNAIESWRTIPELRLLEYMDEPALAFLRPKYEDIPAAAHAALMIEQNLASEEDHELDEWTARLANEQALEEGSWFGLSAADQARFRDFRHTLPSLVTDRVRRNGYSKFGTDFAVPLEHGRELHRLYMQRCADILPGQFTIFGHAGDANNHVNLLPENAQQAHSGEEVIRGFASAVVSMGGTVAAEHGIGKTKIDLLKLMYGPDNLQAMRAVKDILDPGGFLGRGTIFES